MKSFLVVLLLALTSCAASTWNCEAYGVASEFKGMGQITAINELPDAEIEHVCGAQHAGCAIQSVDTVRIYYRTGDECVFRHELCHVMHGPAHTAEYTASVSPRRACPG